MSVAEFSALLQDQAYKTWFKASNTNVLNKSVTELREYEESAKKTDFIITQSTIAEVIRKLTNKDATEAQVTKVIEKLKVTRPKKVIEIHESKGTPTDSITLKFSRLNLKQIGDILNQGFKEELDGSESKISDFFQRGHVFGVATNLVKQTKFGIQQSKLTTKQKELLLGMLDEYISILEKDDLATSNIKNPEHVLYAKYSKNYRRYLVELQAKTINQESGRSVIPITASLRKYFKPENYVLLGKDKLSKDPNTFFSKLIAAKGSPSMVDLISSSLVSSLSGNRIKDDTYIVQNTKVYSKKIDIKSKQANSDIKKSLAEARKVKQQVLKITPRIRSTQGQFYSLASLQALLNTHLQDVVSANMGNEGYPGGQRIILNYRTGRFAESVKVERMSQSRAGAITAFYTYMRNPYEVFEPGHKMGTPLTRDPKLLIAKSIREIAATKVANTMRSVRV